jgi:hypothetical protein
MVALGCRFLVVLRLSRCEHQSLKCNSRFKYISVRLLYYRPLHIVRIYLERTAAVHTYVVTKIERTLLFRLPITLSYCCQEACGIGTSVRNRKKARQNCHDKRNTR